MKRLKRNRPNLHNVIAISYPDNIPQYIGSYDSIEQAREAINTFEESQGINYWFYITHKRKTT